MTRVARRAAASRFPGLAHDEAGVALPMALIVLVVLTSLAAAVLAVGTSEISISTNHMRTAQALALAEAGLESAFTTINTTQTLLASATNSFATLAVTQPGSGSTLSKYGTYTVQYKRVANSTNTVEVKAIGTVSAGGATRALRAIMTNTFNPVTAVLSDGDLTISGSTTVNGGCGSVHTNKDLSITGTGNLIAQNATASDGYSASGSPTIGGVSGGSRPSRIVPSITPSNFRTQAVTLINGGDTSVYLYDFSATGTITQTLYSSGTTVTTTLVSGLGNGDTYPPSAPYLWKFKTSPSKTWEFSPTTGNNGDNNQPGTSTASSPNNPTKAIFYVDGKTEISGDIGTSGSPWNATVISTGDLTVSTGSDPFVDAALNDMIFVTGGDLNLNGNPTINTGVIAANGAVDIGGNVGITGSIIAHGETRLHGTVTVTYNCGLNSGITAGLSEVAWGY